MECFDSETVYYIDEICHVCGAECGTRLCDSCRDETEWQFRQVMGQFTREQVRHIANLVDGVYLEDYLKYDREGRKCR
jgi:hypothetical protein